MENNQRVDERVDWFLKTFGPERFYLEVQPDDQPEQRILNEKLFDLSKRKGVQLVAAGDCHYTTAEDRYGHEIMLAIQTHNKITDPGRLPLATAACICAHKQRCLQLFKGHEEAVWNSGKIADRCNFSYQRQTLFSTI